MKLLKLVLVSLFLGITTALFAQVPVSPSTQQQSDFDAEMQALQQQLKKANFKNDNDFNTTVARSETVGNICDTIRESSEWFVTTNEFKGRRGDPSVKKILLKECQELIYAKMGGKIQQVLVSYFDYTNVNKKSSTAQNIENATQKVCEQMVNETEETCFRWDTTPQPDGEYIAYMGIRISKRQLCQETEKILDQSDDARVRNNKAEFAKTFNKVFGVE